MSESIVQTQRIENARRIGREAAFDGKNIKQVIGHEPDAKVVAAYYKGYAEGMKLVKEEKK